MQAEGGHRLGQFAFTKSHLVPPTRPATELLLFDTGADYITYEDSWLMIDAVAYTR